MTRGGRGLLRVVVGTSRAGLVSEMQRACKCPGGAPGTIVDVVRDWRGVPTYCVVSTAGRLYWLDSLGLLRAQR